MAARRCDLLIIHEHPGIPMAWGTCRWSFPSIYSAVSEKTFESFYVKNNMAAKRRDRWRHWYFFPHIQFSLRWTSKFFILIGKSVHCMQLWHLNEATYYIKRITLVCHGEYLTCAKFQFFPGSNFRDRGPKFFRFFNMAATPHDIRRRNYH